MSDALEYRNSLYADYANSWGKFTSLDDVYEWLDRTSRSLAHEFLPMLPADKNCSILDVGCGCGPLLYMLKQQEYGNTRGIDVSPSQVETAHKVGLHNVKQADAVDFLQNSDHRYDVIFAIDLIEHLNKTEFITLMKSMRGALRPGGEIILRTPNVDAPFGSVYSYGDFSHEMHLNKLSALEILSTLEFRDVQVIPSEPRSHTRMRELLRASIWAFMRPVFAALLFSRGLRQGDVILTPNMVIRARR